MPRLAGTVTEGNDALEGDPALVNSDPEGEGWFFKLTLSDTVRTRRPDGRSRLQGVCRSIVNAILHLELRIRIRLHALSPTYQYGPSGHVRLLSAQNPSMTFLSMFRQRPSWPAPSPVCPTMRAKWRLSGTFAALARKNMAASHHPFFLRLRRL
jgi:hypothetical protein